VTDHFDFERMHPLSGSAVDTAAVATVEDEAGRFVEVALMALSNHSA